MSYKFPFFFVLSFLIVSCDFFKKEEETDFEKEKIEFFDSKDEKESKNETNDSISSFEDEKKSEEKNELPSKTADKTDEIEKNEKIETTKVEETGSSTSNYFSNKDQDSDGVEDEKDECPDNSTFSKMQIWYPDTDKDGYGDFESEALMVCSSPHETESKKYSQNNDDECPTNIKTFKNDSDCDGFENDEDLCPYEQERQEPATWYVDKDGDGKGDVGGKELIQCNDPSGKKGYDFQLSSEDYCPNNKEVYENEKDCGTVMDDNYTYPVKGDLKESDLAILRERILLSLKLNENIVGRKNAELYLTYDPKDHMIMNTLGVFYTRLDNYDKAIEVIEKAIEMTDDDYNKAYYSINLSEAFKKKKQDDKAKKQFMYAASLAEKNDDIKNLLEGRVGGDFLRTYNREKEKFFNYEVSVDAAAMYDSNIGSNENIDTSIVKNYKNSRQLEGFVFPMKVSSDFVFSLKDKKDLRLSKYFSFNYNENKSFTTFNNMDFGLLSIYNYKEGDKKTFTLTNLIHGFYAHDKENNYSLNMVENQLTPSITYRFDPQNSLTGSVSLAYGNYRGVSNEPTFERDYVTITPNLGYIFSFGQNQVQADVFYANKVAAGVEHRSNTYGVKPKVSFNNIFNFFNVSLSSKLARSIYKDRELDRVDNSYDLSFSVNKYFFLTHNQRLFSDVTFNYENKKSIDYSQSKDTYDYDKKTIKFSMRYNYE